MLKDLFKQKKPKDENKERLSLSIADGYVDIKGYKIHKDGTRELVYHDTGDNVVTDWMRHAIISLLGGYIYTSSGRDNEGKANGEIYSRPLKEGDDGYLKNANSNGENNPDGYIMNGAQFYDISSRSVIETGKNADAKNASKNKYIMYPTKILFGTGKEYANFDALSAENSSVNQNWYNDIVAEYGGIQNARKTFDEAVKISLNKFSGTIANNKHSGIGLTVPCRTVNDPDTTSSVIPSSSTMSQNYNVVGAIKTVYDCSDTTKTYLMPSISEVGKLLKPEWRGIGRPCFIYFTQHNALATPSNEIFLSKDSSSDFLNKITFKVVMPAQNATNNAIGKYYPYNGYTLKQMGLYNDAHLDPTLENGAGVDSYAYKNMQNGMLLALKNITSFTKTDDNEMTITWTLTI
jgi:hypothetical protein